MLQTAWVTVMVMVMSTRVASQFFPRTHVDRRTRILQAGPPGGGPAPPPGGGDSSGTSSDACPGADGETCSADGSSGYADASGLVFDAATGVFAGELITNGCNDHPRLYDGEEFGGADTSSCESQSFPTADAGTGLPTLGRAGLTLSGGVNIYSAFEAGFYDCDVGQPCACTGGSCDGGVDVKTCEAHLEYACTGTLNTDMFMDSCGGHATPYHIHSNPVCNYEASDTGHSTVVGLMLDGRPVYGLFETDGSRPCDLDSCLGHVGPVPADETYGVEAGTYYHYHTSDLDAYPATWTPGCYGDPDARRPGSDDAAFFRARVLRRRVGERSRLSHDTRPDLENSRSTRPNR